MRSVIIHVLLFGGFVWRLAQAQTIPYPERLLTLNFQNETFATVFKQIGLQTACVFSYPQKFNDQQRLTVSVYKKPLRLVLFTILKNTGYTYKFSGKFIILKNETKSNVLPAVLNGYIYSALDSTVLEEVSIYMKQAKQVSVSNAFGYFNLTYPAERKNIIVSIAKEDFKDTTVVIYAASKQELIIYLQPKLDRLKHLPLITKDSAQLLPTPNTPLILTSDSTKRSNFLSRFLNRLHTFRPNVRNITDTFFNKVSISLVPKLSTNSLLSFNTINRFSFNVIAGYSKGVNGVELGGILNIVNGNVKYWQAAGFGNLVSGTVTGAQLAGFFNISSQARRVAQLSGFFNMNKHDFLGVQSAGFYNHNGGLLRGVQCAGFLNTAQTAEGLQLAGFGNVIHRSIKGMQLSGFFNYARNRSNAQLAGFINISDSANVQLAGFFNYAKVIKRLQVSVINISDTCAGLPIGLFSYVKKGYHKLEVSSDELRFAYLAFGTGVEKFHSIFSVGLNYFNPNLYTLGYGFGSRFKARMRSYLALNVSTQLLQSFKNKVNDYNGLNRVYVGYEFLLHPKCAVGIGPTFNVWISHAPRSAFYSDFSQQIPYSLYNSTTNTTLIKLWVGAKLSFKFF